MRGRSGGHIYPSPAGASVKVGVALALVSALLGLLGQLAWRSAVPRGADLDLVSLAKLLLDWRVLLGFLLYGLSTLAWLTALGHDEISRLYPLISINYALVLLAGHLIFGETITAAKIFGVALIIAGVVVVALG